MKPAFGDPCNNCGLCCRAQLCVLGSAVFRDGEDRPDGPCEALLELPDGRGACGLIAAPERFAPLQVLRYGTEPLSAAARILTGAGLGCDAEEAGEAHTKKARKFRRFMRRHAPSQDVFLKSLFLWIGGTKR